MFLPCLLTHIVWQSSAVNCAILFPFVRLLINKIYSYTPVLYMRVSSVEFSRSKICFISWKLISDWWLGVQVITKICFQRNLITAHTSHWLQIKKVKATTLLLTALKCAKLILAFEIRIIVGEIVMKLKIFPIIAYSWSNWQKKIVAHNWFLKILKVYFGIAY